MGIDFNKIQWENIKRTYGLWWERKLNRPLIGAILEGKDPGRSQPSCSLLSQQNCHDLSIPAKDIIDRIDYELSKNIYLGDAFPYFNMDCFGPGVVAAFLGADIDNSTGNVWFHPKKFLPINELHFEYDKNNIWLNRIKDIYREGIKKWQGQVLMGMPDLGGILDILATFRTTDNLLMDLYDEPQEVNRLVWELHELWHKFYNEFNGVLQPVNPGYSDWSQLYSDKPMYIPQSDFSYMIGPDMFEEFVRPELVKTCNKLDHTIYHLDGIGELTHLESILNIKTLDAVQWVPGAGQNNQSLWPEVYQQIHSAGKNIQIWGGFDCLDTVAKQIGTYNSIHHILLRFPIEQEAQVRERLAKYGIE